MISIEENDQLEIPSTLPLLPVRDPVVFPLAIVPLFVGREISVTAVEHALASHRTVMLTSQREVLVVLVRPPFGAISKSREGAQRGKHDPPGPEMTPVAGA
jgi:hypothetical protein